MRSHLKTNRGKKNNKCNQCDFATVKTSHKQMQPVWFCILWGRQVEDTLKTHTGEKPNKCNQCDFACSDPSSLWRHVKWHTGQKSNKCNLCDFASTQASDLRRHLKTHSGEKTNTTSVILDPSKQAIWKPKGHSWEKKQTNATSLYYCIFLQQIIQHKFRFVFIM